MIYSMSHKEFQLKKRLDAFKNIGLSVVFDAENCSVDVKHHSCDVLGSAHTEATKFLCDPIYAPKLWSMDASIGKIINELHYEFWNWKFNQTSIIPEETIIIGIKGYIENLECKAQDFWMEMSQESLKENVINHIHDVLNDDFWQLGTVTHYISATLLNNAIHDKNLDWHRIHSNLFR